MFENCIEFNLIANLVDELTNYKCFNFKIHKNSIESNWGCALLFGQSRSNLIKSNELFIQLLTFLTTKNDNIN